MVQLGVTELQKALNSLEKARSLHLDDNNVSLVDLGYRILDSQDRRITDEIRVRVHVRKKIPRGYEFDEFKAKYPRKVPTEDQIGYAVDVPEAPYHLHQWYWYRVPITSHRASVVDPLIGGISISNALKYGYGTLGGKVIDRQTREEMILSNWHVLAGNWAAQPGLSIYQPGRWDGGQPKHTIAYYTRHAFNADIDAAVAKLSGHRHCINDQMELGKVKGVKPPELGMKVVKSGRKSGVTTGTITGIGGYSKFSYDGSIRTVRNVIHITPSDPGKDVSAPGDSGSWWLEAESHHAVALHFAGSDNPEYGLAISMPQVLDALNVDIAYE